MLKSVNFPSTSERPPIIGTENPIVGWFLSILSITAVCGPPGRGTPRQRRRPPSSEHEIAERYFLGREMIGHTLIDVLVGPAQQRQLFAARVVLGVRVREWPAPRRKQNDRRFRPDRFDRLEKWIGLHHHSRAAAVGRVVDCAMLVVRE